METIADEGKACSVLCAENKAFKVEVTELMVYVNRGEFSLTQTDRKH